MFRFLISVGRFAGQTPDMRLTALDQLEIRPSDKVLIVGGGPMGTLAAMTLLEQGVDVRVGEINPKRQEKLREWGIPCETTDHWYAQDKYDKIVVAVNVPALIEEAVRKVKSGGKVHVFAGLPSDPGQGPALPFRADHGLQRLRHPGFPPRL